MTVSDEQQQRCLRWYELNSALPCAQVRLLACFVLLAAGRVVNLAVPILYKRVVDRLSYATNARHPQARRQTGRARHVT